MAAPTLKRPETNLSRQPSFEEVEDDHFRQARLRREARNASPGGWKYKTTLHVDGLERNIRSDLEDPSLRSNDCAVAYERPDRASGVNLIIQSDSKSSLDGYANKLRNYYARRPKAPQRQENPPNEIYQEILHVNSKNIKKKDIEQDLSDPSLQSRYCTFAVRPASAGWDIVIHSRDKVILDGYFRQLRDFYADQKPSSERRQKQLQAQLKPDGSNLSELIAQGLQVGGTGIPALARIHRNASQERNSSRSDPTQNPLPRRPTLSRTASRNESPVSNGSSRKTAQFGPGIHRQTIRLQGYYKGDLSPQRASAWLNELSKMLKMSDTLSGVTVQSSPEEGNTIAFSGMNQDRNAACDAINRYLLKGDPRQAGRWQLKSAEGAFDIYEWCPSPPPQPKRTPTSRRPSLRPQSSTSTNAPLPRRASVQTSSAREPPYVARTVPAPQTVPQEDAPRRPSFYRHVSSSEAQNLLPRRASSATNSARGEHRSETASRAYSTCIWRG